MSGSRRRFAGACQESNTTLVLIARAKNEDKNGSGVKGKKFRRNRIRPT